MQLTRSLTVALFCTLGAACLGDSTYQPPTAYRARLLPVAGSTVSGTVDAVSQGRSETEAGLNAQGEPGTTYGWQINEGSCAQPGRILGGRGAYPDFTTNAATASNPGRGRVDETFIVGLIMREDPYHAVILNAARTTILACGNFERLTF
ncbi:MAG TPA: hypothetical protein VK358_13425 [Longimicrobium sp.]|nr:hypothetical protein [Longimicrobium sp.]